MSDQQLQHNPHDTGYEQQDLSIKGVFYFMVGLAIVVVLVYVIVGGMYKALEARDNKGQDPVNPMAVKTGVDPRTMTFPNIRQKVEQTFPQPVLEHSERVQFNDFATEQDKVLASYDWVDQKNGVVRIPIDQAMNLIVQRGLPVRPQGEAATAQPAEKSKTSPKLNAPGR
jgi:hypothetical protein